MAKADITEEKLEELRKELLEAKEALKEVTEERDSLKEAATAAAEQIEAANKAAEAHKAELAVRDAVIGHYEPDSEVSEVLDRVAYNRKGEAIGYAAPAPAESQTDDATQSQQDGNKTETEPEAPKFVLQQLQQLTQSKATQTTPPDTTTMTRKERIAAYDERRKQELAPAS